jgi:hypothetical protein
LIRLLNHERLEPLRVIGARWGLRAGLLLLIPYLYLVSDPLFWPGVGALAVGELMQLWAAANLDKNNTVASTGPYAFTRNPMYIGRFFVGLAFVLWLSIRWYLLPVYIVAYWLYVHPRVLREEERLVEGLGQPYADYCRQVSRWLPTRRLAGGRALSWSWASVNRNHQLRVTAGVLGVFVLVCIRCATAA